MQNAGLSPPTIKAPSILAIYGMYFLSGAGALVFENVWFSQLGLVVGNSVWSAALVVSAFMAGLALGNGAAVALAGRWRNLVRGYGAMEVAAALSGAALVAAFPLLPDVFRPLLVPFLDDAALLNPIRLGIAFVLMVIPAAALGTTLPLLSRPLEAATGNYGLALGRLYGINTLGAVAGTLLAELALIPAFGLRGSGLFAATCNLAAALIAFRVAQHSLFDAARIPGTQPRAALTADGRRIVLAAFLAGGVLLALEVVWYRFLLLFMTGTTLIFAVMLAVVLAGIGLGGMVAAWLSRTGRLSARVARLAALGAVLAAVGGYAGFDPVLGVVAQMQTESILPPVLLAVFLMGPVCLLSGILFTALGEQLRAKVPDAAAATGVLALANTLGAMTGSLLAGFLLLPALGVERSFFLLASLYAVVALVIPAGRELRWRLAPGLAAAAALVLFPFGRMVDTHYRHVSERYDARLVASREGIVETAFYLAHEFLGETLHYRLATNAYSMSATAILSQRYMRLFAYLPAALHPRIERALLICFGVGVTASALTDLPDVKAIDVVDVSRDILQMSDIAYPDPRRHPLRDARVSTHVEDGRFFLQHVDRRYDLITGEPPPPKIAGIASLYTREYFRLLKDHLNDGGLATYWLPVHQLLERDALAIIRAFCEAFEDCSLWSGNGLDWMLMGSRGGIAPVSREHFSRLWNLPGPGMALRRIGMDTPEQMAAQFMADAGALASATSRVPPLTDDFPQRISPQLPTMRAEPLFARFMDAERSRRHFGASPWIAKTLPASLVAQSGVRFRQRWMLDAALHPELRSPGTVVWSDLADLVRNTDLVTPLRWMLESEARMAEIAARRERADPVAQEHLAIDALANRRSPEARLERGRFLAMTPKGQLVTVFAHCLAGQRAQARSLMQWIPEERRSQEPYRSFFSWSAMGCALG